MVKDEKKLKIQMHWNDNNKSNNHQNIKQQAMYFSIFFVAILITGTFGSDLPMVGTAVIEKVQVDSANPMNSVTHIVSYNVPKMGDGYMYDYINYTNPTTDELIAGDIYDNIPISNRSAVWYRRISQTLIDNATHYITTQTISCSSDRIVIQIVIASIRMMDGGTVWLGPGVFLMDYYVNINNYIHLRGSGMDITTLKLVDNAMPFDVGAYRRMGMLRTWLSMSEIVISDLTLDGNKQNQKSDRKNSFGRNGIHIADADGVWIENVRIKNFQGNGIKCYSLGWGAYGANITIVDSIIEDNDYDGIHINNNDHVLIDKVSVDRNGRHGLNIVRGSQDIRVLFNNITTSAGCGIMIQNMIPYTDKYYGTKNILVRGNSFENNNRGGVCLDDVISITVDQNKFNESYTCFDFERMVQAYVIDDESLISDNGCQANYLYTYFGSTIINVSDLSSTENNNAVLMYGNIHFPTSSLGENFQKPYADGTGTNVTDYDTEANVYGSDYLNNTRWDVIPTNTTTIPPTNTTPISPPTNTTTIPSTNTTTVPPTNTTTIPSTNTTDSDDSMSCGVSMYAKPFVILVVMICSGMVVSI
jgi:hypothetical protein